MTKDEIKKALECCAKSYGDDVHCTDCPYDTLTPRACCERFCQDVLCKDALKIITEQEKEIERLKAKNKVLGDGVAKAFTNGFNTGRKQVEKDIRRAKINALKELKTRHDYANKNMGYPWDISQQIDELIKEVENGEDKS